MPILATDLRWSWDGDFVVTDGDLADTSLNRLLSLIQEAKSRVKSDIGDWKLHPYLGASLSELQGEPNTPALAQEGVTRIKAALEKNNFIPSGMVDVSYVPIDNETILFKIKISIAGANNNEIIQLGLVVDFAEEGIFFIE